MSLVMYVSRRKDGIPTRLRWERDEILPRFSCHISAARCASTRHLHGRNAGTDDDEEASGEARQKVGLPVRIIEF